ncbi:DUF2330 domain-containing protein [Fimbriimonas ginsengisoli]|uniref:DUF2330 domain-containing protein n=1 Tax=Fimbriimonas ginsengisoli Gsoil 348 TaxID=661478 RepID=A0A068NM13_FIMGI|nr:DUF2330 domain-containing protein [Fimbriimonas ginsengisoli]AIE84568.1 hypothetical protein OP10G_1200 [Fimbriimonas ginsengisoli Gsoil 348]
MALGLLATVGGAYACSGVGPPGQPVVFGDQTNIVIWDEAHHTEHFIRNAKFRSGADDFGFIAPTPAKPELSQASSRAFNTLAALAPVVVYSRGFGGGGGMADRTKSAEVQVIQEADVSGYHATTLKCPDAHAINDWMNQHGYISTPEVEKWAERYCSRGWYLTAFKVVDKSKLMASTGTVRMSFRTNKPFNPFYVPATNIPINGGGTLRVYFVSVGNYDALIGHSETWQTPQWTSAVPEASAALLAKQAELPFASVPDNCQVEAFVDNNFPRPAADDIYFVKRPTEASSSKLIGLPGRQIPTTAAMSLLVSLGVFAVARRRRSAG